MAISEKQARAIAEKMVEESPKNVRVTDLYSVADDDYPDGLYVFWVEDKDTGMTYVPGELFKAISKRDGELVDFTLPMPAF